MKILLLIPVVGLALFASSCRTVTPTDPMTGKQSERCLPGGCQAASDCQHIHGTK
jgi:hypothetical protein